MEPPSARPWLGVGVALSALPAAGGCFCAALVLAVVADSDPGAVYEQHRWLGAVVAASAVCAYVAMMGWSTLRHGGLPAPVLLTALVLAAVPFLLPGGLFLPAAVLAVAGSSVLATGGLAHPPASPDTARFLTGFLAAAAPVLAVGQAIGVGLHGVPDRPRAKVLGTHALVAPKGERKPRTSSEPRAASERSKAAPSKPAPAAPPEEAAPSKPPEAAPAPAAPPEAAPPAPPEAAPAPLAAPPAPVAAAARRFVRDYYAALDQRRFAVAWGMLAPEVQTAFGGFKGWREGYARTISHSARGLTVTPAGAGATVGLTLRAGDRSACGTTVVRRFAVTWRLARMDAGWRATAASARKVGGPEPAATCSL